MNKQEMPKKLLAKSRFKSGEELSLEKHLCDTEEAARQIFRLEGRWGQNWCRFFKLRSKEAQERFLLNLRIAALFHDIGKANEDFYAAVSKPGFTQQTLRHEHLSALILFLPEVRQWLAQNTELDLDVITAAVLSHHIKAADSGDDYRWCQPKNKRVLKLYLQHLEVEAILKRIGDIAQLPALPKLPANDWAESSPWAQAWQNGIRAARMFGRSIRLHKDSLALLLATKAGVIVADAAASGLVREGQSINQWIEDNVHSRSIDINDISDAIITPRTQQVSRLKGKPFEFHPFQIQVTEQGSRVLLLAACAAGKTLAAWKWAETQAREYNIGKVIFLYPTRGTATEGFRDYVGWAPETEGAYVAGDSRYVLEGMRENPSEATTGKKYQLSEAEERLFALGLWSRRYFSATVDQFLGFMEHSYTSLCLLPMLADSAVIIDEVHSFDRKMFDVLISFLQTFDIPVLCMTATLPPSRCDELIKAGLKIFPTEADLANLESLQIQESHPRYKLEPVANNDEAFSKAVTAYRKGERVLWVVNTVARCQQEANRLQQELNQKVLSYHSRFKLTDRQAVHKATVAAFQQTNSASIAVTTQVCEMSLDLDADVLISEVAPISSLVQRFGRANRHPENKSADFRARLHTYATETLLPYTVGEITAAKTFLNELGSGDVSQKYMAELLKVHALNQRQADGSARFLDGGYFATPGAFRDTDEFSHPCILDSDLETVKTLLDQHQPIDGFIINVPGKPEKYEDESGARPAWLPKYLGIANSKLYSKERGFQTE
jgi:CRISPR-associated endonuclease/helicase Cas3